MNAPIQLIYSPLLSEKATAARANGTYVFLVAPHSTKSEIKKAVKGLYKVDAVKVTIIRTTRRPRRFYNRVSAGVEIKKAMVTIKKGQTIDLSV